MIPARELLKFPSNRSRNGPVRGKIGACAVDNGDSPVPTVTPFMIIKTRDASERTIVALERCASASDDTVHKGGCHSAAARLRADPTTEEACALVDHWFADAEEWAVIHDLRLRVDGHAVQLNHVLIGDTLQVVCLDTRWIRHALEIAERGPCRAIGIGEIRLVASPLDALARNVRKLGTELRHVGPPRGRFGLGPRTTLRGCVLVDPSRRSSGVRETANGAVGVYPRDALQKMFWKTSRRAGRTSLDRLSGERLERFATALAERHHPSFSPHLLGDGAARFDGRIDRARTNHAADLVGRADAAFAAS